jgi:hypothetical protein
LAGLLVQLEKDLADAVDAAAPLTERADQLAAMRLDFTATVRELLQVMIAGLLARSSR